MYVQLEDSLNFIQYGASVAVFWCIQLAEILLLRGCSFKSMCGYQSNIV